MNGNDYTQRIIKLFNVTFERVFASVSILYFRYLLIRLEAAQMCAELYWQKPLLIFFAIQ